MSLSELAERCERASGPDQGLDIAIHTAATTFEPRLGGPGWPKWAIVVPAFPGWKLLPEYTASLDAAMMLVPEGHDWLVRNDEGGAFANVSRKDATNRTTAWIEGGPRPSDEQLDREGTLQGNRYCRAATPALALCGAALKARAASCDTRRMAETGNTDSVRSTGGAVPARADAQRPPQ